MPKTLVSMKKEFIQTINKTHFSFYIVLETISGQSLTIKDLLLNIVFKVKEKSASQAPLPGHIIFARVLKMDEQCIIVGMSPYAIIPNKSKIVLDFKKDLKSRARKPLDSKMLRNTSSFELRYLYFDLLDESFNAPPPQLYNTDGKPINMCTVHFALHTTTEIACMTLAPLMLEPDAWTQFKRALKDKNTPKDAFSFPWLEKGNKLHKNWDNTIKGHITIKADNIIIEVNSQRRAEQARELVERIMRDKVSYQSTKTQSIESLAQKKAVGHKTKDHDREQDINLNELPEIRAQMRQQIQAHWNDWFEQKIPALNNKTPLQAAKTKAERELLELLFLQYEFANQRLSKDDLNQINIALLRSKLALENT